MSNNSNLFNFTENQTRALIHSLLYVAQKNSGSVPISNLNESAEVVAYCAGFNSWKEMKKSLRLNNSLTISKNEFTYPSHLLDALTELNKPYLEAQNLIYSASNIKEFENKIKLKPYPLSETKNGVTSNYQSSTGMIIGGSYFNEGLKYEHIYHLNPQNTLCFSERKDFYNAFIQQARNKGKHHIVFSKENKNEESADYLHLKLDPLNDIYCSEHFDILFSLNYDENSSFEVLWSLLVKDYISRNNFILTSSFLKYSLTLEFLSFYLLYLKKNQNPLTSLLLKYLHSLNVSIKENNISYSLESSKTHLENIKDIQLKVLHIEQLYLDGTFAVSARKNNLSYLKNRINLLIHVPNIIDDFTAHIYNVTTDEFLTSYEEECEKENYDYLEYQVLVFNSYEELFKDFSIYNKNYSYHIRNSQNFSKLMETFPQIIFCKNEKNQTPPQDWLIKFYTNTEDLDNIFAFQNHMLHEINTLEAFLWQRTEKHPVTSLDVFKMFLINPYLK